jgi:hypothetical protein
MDCCVISWKFPFYEISFLISPFTTTDYLISDRCLLTNWLMVGCNQPVVIALMVAMASNAPAAPRQCPIIDYNKEKGIVRKCENNMTFKLHNVSNACVVRL